MVSQGGSHVPRLFLWATLAPQPAAGPCPVGRAELLPGSCTLPQPVPIHQGLGFTTVLSSAVGGQGWWVVPPPPSSPLPARYRDALNLNYTSPGTSCSSERENTVARPCRDSRGRQQVPETTPPPAAH